MSKKARARKTHRKPTTFLVELAEAELEIILRAFGEVIDGPLPDSPWIERLMNIEMKFVDPPSVAQFRAISTANK